jgi:hypothetical protein
MRREAGREVGTMSWRSGYLGVAGAALLLVWGCRGAAEDVADLAAGEGLDSRDAAGDSPAHESESGPAWVEQEQVPSQGYLARQAEYLEACNEQNAPPLGGIYGQACRIVKGETTFADAAVAEALERVNTRKDTADFRVAALVRMLYLDNEHQALPPEMRQALEEALLGFRYWLSEPGDDKMCFWTENHQILFHSGEVLAGQLFPDEVFSNAGMTGAEHMGHAEPLLLRWLDFRGRFGFSEWHSNVYFNEDMPALINLIDFAQNPEIRTKAAMVLDLMAYDLLNNTFKGLLATTHGRTYPDHFIGRLSDSTAEAAWLILGLGQWQSAGNFSAAFLATSKGYVPPPLLEQLAMDVSSSYEHRQRDSIFVQEGPEWGIGYTAPEDVVFWAGMAALADPEVINGTCALLDQYGLWEGFLFGDIPEPYKSMLAKMAGTPELVSMAEEMSGVSRGIGLEGISTYTWRRPHYQLSGAQDYKPGFWASQTFMWIAALDEEAYVFTTYPANMEEMGTDLEFGGPWIGGWLPRATFHENVGIVQYRPGSVPLLDEYLTGDHLHAYFPQSGFDEVRSEGVWTLGRKGDGYVALASQAPTHWSPENDYELVADVQENVWVVELGSADEHASFEAFVEAISAAELTFGEEVRYVSPTVGAVEVGWEGAMTVGGQPIDLGPYPRWSNPHCSTPFGDRTTVIGHGDLRLELDFNVGSRRFLARH